MKAAGPRPFTAPRDQWLMLGLGGLVAAAVAWAYWSPVDQIVRAEGRIIAASRAQMVQHLEGGIVKEILVHEGQVVAKGQVLMNLSDVQANSSVQQGQSRQHVLLAQQARLVAEAQGKAEPGFADTIPQEMRQEALQSFRERVARLQSERSVISQQMSQRQAELAEARQRIQATQSELDLARKQSSLMEGLFHKGAASQMEMLDAQGRTQRLTTTLNDIQASLPRLQLAVSEASARIEETSARFRAEASTELAQVSAELEKLNQAVKGQTDILDRTEVRAPASGYVNRLNFNTVGGVIKPGEVLLEITPNQGPIAVEARVRPNDRASLRPGLPTRVMVGAYDYSIYGALTGQITEVSADTLPDETGQRYYRVLIQTDAPKGAMAAKEILPGMTARADVVVGQRSVMSYLLSPLTRFRQQAFSEPS